MSRQRPAASTPCRSRTSHARPTRHHQRDLQPELLVLQRAPAGGAAGVRRPAGGAARASTRRAPGDAREIVLTGGEPTLRSDLADLVRRAAARRHARRARDQRRADRRGARARRWPRRACTPRGCSSWPGGDAADAITRDPGGFAAALRGIRALAAAGVTVEVTAPVVRRNLALAGGAARGDRRREAAGRGARAGRPDHGAGPDASAPRSPRSARAVAAVADAARRVGLARAPRPDDVRAAVHLREAGARRASLRAQPRQRQRGRTTSTSRRARRAWSTTAARGCRRRRSPAGTLPPLHPIVEQRLRRRLTVVSSVEEQIARELVGRDELRGSAYEQVPEYTVRVNFHCNQACEFCFVSTHLPPPAEAAVRDGDRDRRPRAAPCWCCPAASRR